MCPSPAFLTVLSNILYWYLRLILRMVSESVDWATITDSEAQKESQKTVDAVWFETALQLV